MSTISKERRDAAKALIREALRFADWAAGEGIAPADGQPATAPDEFLAAYSDATGDDDWDALADRLPALLDALASQAAEIARLREALRQIADLDEVEAALDPEWTINRARAALNREKP